MKDDTLSDVHPSRVVPFKPKAVTPEVKPSNQSVANEALVEMFSRYLISAKEGKIQFAAVAAVDDKGVAFSTWEPADQENSAVLSAALGSVAFLSHRLNASCDEGAKIDTVGQDN